MPTDDNGNADASSDAGATQTQDAGNTQATGGNNRAFTQDEVNRFVAAERRKIREEMADYADLKQKASKLDELEAERLSDIEKAQQASQAALERATRAETELANERLRSAVYTAAMQQGAVDPDAVLALLDRSNLLDKQGQPQGVSEAITLLLEAKPYLKAQAGPSRPTGDIGQQGRSPDATGAAFTREQLKDSKFFEANRDAIFAAIRRGETIQ